MDRRAFLGALGLLAAPLGVEAQQAGTVFRIGHLNTNLATNPHLLEAFRQGLRDLGYVEGRNLVIEYRDAKGEIERLPAFATELVALKVDVIVAGAGGTAVALAAKRATKDLPIFFIAVGDRSIPARACQRFCLPVWQKNWHRFSQARRGRRDPCRVSPPFSETGQFTDSGEIASI